MNIASDAAHRSNPGRRLGNVVLRVESYDNEALAENCHPGAVNGTVMGGPLDGQEITVHTRMTPTNAKVATIADLQDDSRLVHTLPGGYLALENLRFEEGRITTQWVNKMGDPDAILRAGLPMQVMPAFGSDGSVRRFRSNGATIYNCSMLHVSQARQVADPDSLRQAMAEVAGQTGAATIALVLKMDRGMHRKTISAARGWVDGQREPVDDTLKRFFSSQPESRFRQVFEQGGVADVIPTEMIKAGPKVAQSMDLGIGSAIPLDCYQTGGLGVRIEAALRRAETHEAARIEQGFLDQAHDNAKSRFAENGWRGVWNSDIERYFNRLGISLPRIPRYGFAVSTAVLRPYGGDPSAGCFLAKARTMSAAVPRNAVPTPSDPKSLARLNDALSRAVEQAIELAPDALAARLEIDKGSKFAKTPSLGSEPEGGAETVFRNVDDRVEPGFVEQLDF